MTRENSTEKIGEESGLLEKRYGDDSAQKIRDRAGRLSIFASLLLSAIFIAKRVGAFETYPFGIALVAAASGQYIPIFAGAVIGYIVSDMGRGYLFAYIAVALVRWVMRFAPMPNASRELKIVDNDVENNEPRDAIEGEVKKEKGILNIIASLFGIDGDKRDNARKENSRLMDIQCMLFSAVGGFVAGFFDLVENDFSFYSLYGLLFMTFVCPVMSYFLIGALRQRNISGEIRFNVGVCALIILCAFAIDEAMFFGMMILPIFCVASSLFVAERRGVVSGCTVALIVGLILNPLYMPLLILAVICYCMLEKIKKSVALASVCGIIVLYCYYLGSTDGIVNMLTPMLFGVPVFLVVERLLSFIDPQKKEKRVKCDVYFTEAIIEKDKNMAVRGKIYALSDAFASLSKTFYELSDIFHRPDALHLRDITDEAFNSVCQGCRNKEVCYGSGYNKILEANAKITSALHTKGCVKKEDVDFGCIRFERILKEVNALCSKYTEELIKNQKVHAFASNYEDVNAVLLDAINSDDGEYECDTDTGERIFEYLSSLGFEIRGVVLCGKRSKRVTVRGLRMSDNTSGEKADSILRGVSDIVGEEMTGPVFEIGNDGTDMIFTSKPRYSVICSHARRAAFEGLSVTHDSNGEELIMLDPFDDSVIEKRDELCGDVTSAFLTDNSYFYSMICDGMGSGKDAALCAGICSSFAQKMLFAGNRADITLRMLNNFLRSENCDNGKECSVAIDLFELDLMRGTASFIKSGAVPTYILREGKVYKVSSRTMPIGIIKVPDIKISKLDMQKGDIVVMISDGCIEDGEECLWLTRMLCEFKIQDNFFENGDKIAESLRDSILLGARNERENKDISDDISVSVTIII